MVSVVISVNDDTTCSLVVSNAITISVVSNKDGDCVIFHARPAPSIVNNPIVDDQIDDDDVDETLVCPIPAFN